MRVLGARGSLPAGAGLRRFLAAALLVSVAPASPRSAFAQEGTTTWLDTITIVERPKQPDSVEVQVNGEFIGVLFRDEEDGEVSYAFNMAILEMDLPEAPAGRG